MRVGVLVHDLHGGGAEAVARSWATHLADRGHEVVFLLYGPNAGADIVSGLPAAVFPGQSVSARWTLLPLWLRREAGRRRLDVLLSVLDFSNIVGLLASLGSHRPVVISEHATPSLLWLHKGAGGVAKRLAGRLLYRRATAAVAVSHAVATDLRVALSVSADRVVVLANPVAAAFATLPLDSGRSRGQSTGHRILVVGRLAPEKRVDRALEVLRELRRMGGDWTGCVIGDGPLRPELEKTAEREDLPVEFLGWVHPWQAEARAGDVLLVTSDLEGFGNVLVEAAGAGIPSVAPSPALGVADAVLPELTGMLSSTNSIEDLADAVLRAARLHVPSAAVRAWLQRFEPERAAEELEAVLERAVAATGARATRAVTHVGPAPEAQGGMASVLRTYRDAGVPGWRSRFLTSYVADAPLWSAGPALRVLVRLLLLPTDRLGLVHVHLSYGGSFVREGGLAALASLRKCPVVLTLHGSDFAGYAGRRPRLVTAVLRRADRVVLLSESHRALLPPDLRSRTVVVPNTVTRDPGAPTPPADAPRVLFAGELSYRKGLDVLLAAWTQVRERVPAAELLVAGPPGDIGPTEHAGVRWVGAVENAEIRSLLRTSRAAVLPSRREAMPMFVLEAMSAGRPVIGTPVGAVADTLADAGLVVPVGDVNALAEALVRLLQPGPAARRMGAAGRAGFEARFAAELGLAALRDVYEATGSARFSPATAGAQVEHA